MLILPLNSRIFYKVNVSRKAAKGAKGAKKKNKKNFAFFAFFAALREILV